MSLIKQSTFFRIYLGLICLVMLVAILSYLLVQVINQHRAQEYRESMANGITYTISEVIIRQSTPQAQLDWMSDVSSILELPLSLVRGETLDLSRRETSRLNSGLSVVRYDQKTSIGDIYGKIKGYEDLYLHIRVDKLSEVQLKMLPILVLEDLVYFPGNEEQRLKELQHYFPYPIGFKNLNELNLDMDQISRLRMDRVHTILLHKDQVSTDGATISAISAYTNVPNKVLVLGPAPVFTWMPIQLAAVVTLLSLLLLSIGSYLLLRPLQIKLAKIRQALNCVRKGDLHTRLDVHGHDELATVSLSFNMMTEHIQRLIEAQRELTRAVSHELRTPVARIRFGMEMLTDTDEYESRINQMEMIDKDIEALDSLIDEIMTYAKLEQGIPLLNFEQIVLRDVIEQVIRETNVVNKTKKITVDLPDENIVVEAEYRYLHRVVQNFVGNAMRYSEDEIHVSAGVKNGKAFVCVEDNGDGIPEVDRERVFEAFARLDDSRTRASGGYGLGLSIVSRIAYWFGGVASVDQSPSLGGARFMMTWPQSKNAPVKRKLREKIRNIHSS